MPDFRILGPLEVVDETGTLLLGGLKQRAVLALLLLEAPKAVSTDRSDRLAVGGAAASHGGYVAAQLPHAASEAARRRIFSVTKSPGYPANRLHGGAARSRPAYTGLARRGQHGLDPRPGRRMLREALALWRGPPLADFTYEAFAEAEIARLEELRLTALEERVDADLEAGRHAEFVGELEGLVAAIHSRALVAPLMLALYRSGRRAEAIQVYEDARRRLADELGIEPRPALRQLHGRSCATTPNYELAGSAPPVRAPLRGGGGGSSRRAGGPRARRRHAPSSGSGSRCASSTRPTGAGLTGISEYVAVMKGSGPLYDELHALLDADEQPTAVHRFFAACRRCCVSEACRTSSSSRRL